MECALGGYGAREIAKDKGAAARFTLHVVFVPSLLAVGGFACLAMLVVLINQPWPVKQLLLLCGVTLFGFPRLFPWVFRGCDLMQYVALVSITRWSVFAVGVLLFIRGPDQIWIVPFRPLTTPSGMAYWGRGLYMGRKDLWDRDKDKIHP